MTKQKNITSQIIQEIAPQLTNKEVRQSFMETNVKMSVANQIKALRGDQSQAEFGAIVGKTQSVVSRLEDPEYGKWALQTMLEIVTSLDLALIVKVVDYPTFLRSITDYSDESLVPSSFSSNQIKEMEEFTPSKEEFISGGVNIVQQTGQLTSQITRWISSASSETPELLVPNRGQNNYPVGSAQQAAQLH